MARTRERTYRVILADGDGPYRRWLRSLLEESEDFQVVGEAGTAAEALDLIALLVPGLVIADVEMPDENGLDMMAHIRREFPAMQPILVSSHTEPQYQKLAMEAGVLAFIPKAALSLDALRQGLQGGG